MATHSNFQFQDFPTAYLSTHIPKEADVVIVGGGLAGLLTLYYLTIDSKLNVYLLEEGALGYHASGRDIGTVNLFDGTIIRKILDNPDAHT
jgi:choline dehydrogenase-like flavoprotein